MNRPSEDDEIHKYEASEPMCLDRVLGKMVDISKVELLLAAATAGPFVTACCTELGKRFGGALADWTSRLRHSAGSSAQVDLPVKVGEAVTVLELREGLPDEARLALIDLDFSAQAIRGQTEVGYRNSSMDTGSTIVR